MNEKLKASKLVAVHIVLESLFEEKKVRKTKGEEARKLKVILEDDWWPATTEEKKEKNSAMIMLVL